MIKSSYNGDHKMSFQLEYKNELQSADIAAERTVFSQLVFEISCFQLMSYDHKNRKLDPGEPLYGYHLVIYL